MQSRQRLHWEAKKSNDFLHVPPHLTLRLWNITPSLLCLNSLEGIWKVWKLVKWMDQTDIWSQGPFSHARKNRRNLSQYPCWLIEDLVWPNAAKARCVPANAWHTLAAYILFHILCAAPRARGDSAGWDPCAPLTPTPSPSIVFEQLRSSPQLSAVQPIW